jgi:hypothetical protein
LVDVESSKARERFFFLKKRTKKTFGPVDLGNSPAKTRRSKSFLVTFFQKRNGLPLTLLKPITLQRNLLVLTRRRQLDASVLSAPTKAT